MRGKAVASSQALLWNSNVSSCANSPTDWNHDSRAPPELIRIYRRAGALRAICRTRFRTNASCGSPAASDGDVLEANGLGKMRCRLRREGERSSSNLSPPAKSIVQRRYRNCGNRGWPWVQSGNSQYFPCEKDRLRWPCIARTRQAYCNALLACSGK